MNARLLSSASVFVKHKLYLLLLSVAVASLLFIFASPWHMDEFVMFHRYGCGQDAQSALSAWIGSNCGKGNLPISILGVTYDRSYPYIGIASSIFIAPLVLIVDAPEASMIAGLMALFLCALLLCVQVNVGLRFAILPILWFPLSYSLVHDSGPIRLSIVAIPVIGVAIRLLYEKFNIKTLILACFSVAFATVALEDKPFFVYLLPGTVLLSLALVPNLLSKASPVRLARILSYSLALLGSQLFFLSAAFISRSQSYLDFLAKSGPTLEMRIENLSEAFRYIFTWPYYASRIYPIDTSTFGLPSWISLSFCLLVIVLVFRNGRALSLARGRHCIPFILCASVLFFLAACVAGGKFGHHFVYSQLPLVVLFMLFARYSKQNAQVDVLLPTAAIALATIISLAGLKPVSYASSHFEPLAKMAFNLLGPRDVLNCGSWGCYYGHSFAGNSSKAIVSAESAGDLTSLVEFVSSRDGRTLHLCNSNICSAESLASLSAVSNVELLTENIHGWKLFVLD